jgi:membrane-associated phospholipid phosphatase
LLLPGWKARRNAAAGALALGALLGLVRIAQGGHFLSDVVASGLLVFAVSWALYRLIVAWNGLGALAAVLCKPPPNLKYFIALSAVSALVFAYAVAYLDGPLMLFSRDTAPLWRAVFRFITEFGVSTPYLVVSALAACIHFVAARAAKAGIRKDHLFHAWRASYLFLAVAVSGLIADLIKPVAGRARPKLFFSDHISGFTGFGPRPDYWSFPSGHSVTAAALAFVLCVLYPRWRPAWIVAALLVGASRVGLDAHHLSDVWGGFYIGLATAWALYAVLRTNGIALSESDSRGSPGESAARKPAPRRRSKARA